MAQVEPAIPSRAALPAGAEQSYVDWPAVLAGAILAAAIAFVLITFGTGLGLSMLSPHPGETASVRWFTVAAGIWFLWVSVSSFAAGGYLAGRLRRRIGDATEDEVETRDGAHGVLVWAVGALLGAVLAAGGVTGLVGGAARTLGAAADPIAAALQTDMGYYADTVLGDAADPATRDQMVTVLGHALRQDQVPPEDRDALIAAATSAGVSDTDAGSKVDAALGKLAEARKAAVAAAERARVVAVVSAFIVAASLLASAAAAFFAACLGGEHRDQNVPFRSFRR